MTGSEENAEKIAKASEHYNENPYFWALSNVDSPKTRVADLYSNDFGFVDRLLVYAVNSGVLVSGGSFGVLDKDTVGVARKNK